jgi:prevent-host-death family protein
MPTIGVQQLRANTAEVLRHVQQEHTEYVVTRKGQPVARLVPVASAEAQRSTASRQEAWEEYVRWADEARRRWPKDLSTQALMDEIRG